SLIHDGYHLDTDDKRMVAQRVAEVMAEQISDKGSATDCSRIAWLYLHLNDEIRARDLTELGLARDSENEYCFRLARRFGIL
ncbi:MAG: hypothetical protein ACRDHP_17545, partial [Ktedonobacterales bacterium]